MKDLNRPFLTALQEAALVEVEKRRSSNAVTGAQLAGIIGLKPRSNGKPGADLRAVINALRVKGYPICASGEGYWWPQDASELTEYVRSLEGRIREQQAALEGLQKGYGKVNAPRTMAQEIADSKKGGIYVIRRQYPQDDSYVQVASEQVDQFLIENPTAKKCE